MPALQTLTVTDRTPTTPVDHAFVPRDVSGGVGLVVESSGGVPVNESRITIAMRKSGGKFRGKLTLAVPVVTDADVNGVSVPTLQRTGYVTMEVTFDERSTLQERNNAIGMFASALGTDKALVHKALVELEGVYG